MRQLNLKGMTQATARMHRLPTIEVWRRSKRRRAFFRKAWDWFCWIGSALIITFMLHSLIWIGSGGSL